MLKIALTGGIATGKSYVLEQFRRHGVPCLDADVLAHGVMAAGTEATAAIAARFGQTMLAPDGSVDRATLGPMVFADAIARRDLEAIVHPVVYRAISAGVRGFELTGNDPVVVVDIPLLYETGHDTDFDRVIVTTCRPETQLARLVARGLSEAAARQRIAAQWTGEDKVARANWTIGTDGPCEDTARQVEDILNLLHTSTSCGS